MNTQFLLLVMMCDHSINKGGSISAQNMQEGKSFMSDLNLIWNL
jgi:hypothetical protein